jgi:hypothetical protein
MNHFLTQLSLDKEPNYFEVLKFNSTQASLEEVQKHYEIL